MGHGRHVRRLAQLGIIILTFHRLTSAEAAAGVLDHLRSPAAQPATLAPRTTVAWSIDSGSEHTPIMGGKGLIGPDGTLILGPYGSVRVAGLTILQAESAIERHLAAYVFNPRVRLTVEREGQAGEPVAKPLPPAGNGAPASVPAATASAPAAVPAQPITPPKPSAQIALVGAPAPTDEAGPAATDWRPVQRPLSGADTPSDWRPVPRPGQAGSGVAFTGYEAPMPVGPVREPGAPPAAAPKPDELKIPPRPVPGQAEGMVMTEGPGPGCAAPGAGMAGPAGPPPHECGKVTLPTYVIEPPDILIVESTLSLRDQPVRGQHLVRPDGTISLGIYGTVRVAGLTLEQAKIAIWEVLSQRVPTPEIIDPDTKKRLRVDPLQNLYVDVLAYNSKWYYVITDGGGYGEQVVRLPITGNETVLDAISQIYGLPPVASKKDIWVARSFPCQGGHGSEQVLPVDWCGITKRGQTATNYQIMPGDRIYVKAQRIIRADSVIAKVLSPVERILGVTLLGSSTVNSIRNSNSNGGNGVP
jgi:polysaccharide export outer membrane protein